MNRRRRGAALSWCVTFALLFGVQQRDASSAQRAKASESEDRHFSTLLGGSRNDVITDIAVDRQGDVYATGWTNSVNFAVHGGLQTRHGGGDCDYFSYEPCGDAFVAKMRGTDGSIVWSTFLGGSASDAAHAVEVDRSGAVYVTGQTNSADFPTLDPVQPYGGGTGCRTGVVGRRDLRRGPCTDIFVAKLNPEGSGLVFSTFLGGAMNDVGRDIAIGRDGSVHVAGSAGPGIPTKGGIGPPPQDPENGFLAKLDPAGASVIYSAYLGGGAEDRANAVALDREGNAYVTGEAFSEDFPSKAALQPKAAGGRCRAREQRRPCSDAFLTKVSADGTSLVYSTYLGGRGDDVGNDVAVDASGAAFVTGGAGSDFPIKNAAQAEHGGGTDAFVLRISPSGRDLVYSTLLGGPGADNGRSIALARRRVYLAGDAGAGLETKHAFQPERAGHTDTFAAALDTTEEGEESLLSATYLGGTGRERATAVIPDSSGAVMVAGLTDSLSDFPTLKPAQERGRGEVEGFVARFSLPEGGPLITKIEPRSGPLRGGTEVVITGSNLDRVKTVRFGAKAAGDAQMDSGGEEITVRTPEGSPGPVQVTLETENGPLPVYPGARFVYGTGSWHRLPFEERHHHSAVSLSDGRVLISGGCTAVDSSGNCTEKALLKSAEIFDPRSHRWEGAGEMTRARAGYSATLLPTGPRALCGDNCGKVLVVGGAGRSFAEIFDPASGRWSSTAAPPAGDDRGHTVTLLATGPPAVCGGNCGKVLLVRGLLGGESPPLGLLFDPKQGRWAPAGPDTLQTSTAASGQEAEREVLSRTLRAHHTATLLPSGKVLLVGGVSIASTELYDPVSGRFTRTDDPLIYRYAGHSATLLRDGKVLLAGGMTDNIGTVTSGAEIYDPEAPSKSQAGGKGTWIPTDSLSSPRYAHGAAVLSNGDVLVVGGSDSTGEPRIRRNLGTRLATAEIFDIRAGRWEHAGSVSQGRGAGISMGGIATYVSSAFTATPLRDGRVLIVGGGPSSEIFDPSGADAPSQAIRTEWWLSAFSVALVAAAVAGYKMTRSRLQPAATVPVHPRRPAGRDVSPARLTGHSTATAEQIREIDRALDEVVDWFRFALSDLDVLDNPRLRGPIAEELSKVEAAARYSHEVKDFLDEDALAQADDALRKAEDQLAGVGQRITLPLGQELSKVRLSQKQKESAERNREDRTQVQEELKVRNGDSASARLTSLKIAKLKAEGLAFAAEALGGVRKP